MIELMGGTRLEKQVLEDSRSEFWSILTFLARLFLFLFVGSLVGFVMFLFSGKNHLIFLVLRSSIGL